MIQLGRFDELGSGVRNISKYLPIYSKGANPVFKEEKQLFKLTLPMSGAQSLSILKILLEDQYSADELVNKLNLSSKTGSFKRIIKVLLEDKLIKYTIPEKPNSRLQKYRLTDKGKKVLQE